MPIQLPVRDRPFDDVELERMRLLLSTFKDGSGQRVKAGYMPDYLSFERVTAYVLGGDTNEDKGIFDVDVPSPERGVEPWGVSCKMTTAQRRSWFMELSNSAKYLHDALLAAEIDAWHNHVAMAGPVLVDTVESWYAKVADEYDLSRSKYLLLTHDARWHKFEIACFDIDLLVRCDPRVDVNWVAEGQRNVVSSLAGYIQTEAGPHRLWQWYANSGGQLKFYPPFGWEEWRTGEFVLEEPPVMNMAQKVEDYWPGAWPT